MKKYLVFAFCLVLTIPLTLFSGCSPKIKDVDNNYDGMFINFSKYQGFGAAAVKSSQSSKNIMAYNVVANNANSERTVLIGITNDNIIEEIEFEKNIENSNRIEKINPKLNLFSFYSYNLMTFVCFTKGNLYTINNTSFFNDDIYSSYVIDNRTGKIYSLGKFGGIGLPDSSFINSLGKDSMESDNAVFVKAYGKKGEEYMSIYKFSFENELLVTEEIINSNLINFNNNIFADKYGNFFFSESGSDKDDYIIKIDKTLAVVNDYLVRAPNGKVYTKDLLYTFDQTGEKVINNDTEISELKYLSERDKIYSNEDSNYYFLPHDIMKNVIYKYTKLDNDNFLIEDIAIEEFSDKYAISGKYMYFLDIEKLSKIDITNGRKESEVTDYFFKSIESNNLGDILFEATNSSLETVKGIIKADGTIDISIKENNFNIFYIKSLN